MWGMPTAPVTGGSWWPGAQEWSSYDDNARSGGPADVVSGGPSVVGSVSYGDLGLARTRQLHLDRTLPAGVHQGELLFSLSPTAARLFDNPGSIEWRALLRGIVNDTQYRDSGQGTTVVGLPELNAVLARVTFDDDLPVAEKEVAALLPHLATPFGYYASSNASTALIPPDTRGARTEAAAWTGGRVGSALNIFAFEEPGAAYLQPHLFSVQRAQDDQIRVGLKNIGVAVDEIFPATATGAPALAPAPVPVPAQRTIAVLLPVQHALRLTEDGMYMRDAPDVRDRMRAAPIALAVGTMYPVGSINSTPPVCNVYSLQQNPAQLPRVHDAASMDYAAYTRSAKAACDRMRTTYPMLTTVTLSTPPTFEHGIAVVSAIDVDI